MSDHTFRNPDLFQVLPFRDWIRKNKPGGFSGFVVEDLDLVIRLYGNLYSTDSDGKFMLIELKFFPKWIDRAQTMTFKLIDRLLRKADPNKERYFGYFVVQYDNSDWDMSKFWVNKVPMDKEMFLKFLDMKDQTVTLSAFV